ncbi:MAG TPA: pathogenicity-like protein [Pseudoxanthomonas sp.]|nr:pathogenicity-like protein [Pseudoxanthomonas sp.]
MRQVFTSLRVETVEGVAKLLEEAGIEVYLANGRSYHSKRGGQFSYAEPMKLKQQPSVWVKRAEDQPRAREILRAAGLLATTRPSQGEPLVFAGNDAVDEPKKRPLAWRIRIALLIAIAIAALVTVLRPRPAPEASPPVPQQAPLPTQAEPQAAPQPVPAEEEEVRVRIPAPPPAKP